MPLARLPKTVSFLSFYLIQLRFYFTALLLRTVHIACAYTYVQNPLIGLLAFHVGLFVAKSRGGTQLRLPVLRNVILRSEATKPTCSVRFEPAVVNNPLDHCRIL